MQKFWADIVGSSHLGDGHPQREGTLYDSVIFYTIACQLPAKSLGTHLATFEICGRRMMMTTEDCKEVV
jgi:hypothetical protein